MTPDRRTLLSASAAFIAAALSACTLIPKKEATMTAIPKGKPGDFDFLQGDWTIQHRRRLADGTWDTYSGEATCWTILGGVCSVEELRIPARDFSGMGLRTLHAETQIWHDVWMNAKSGIVTGPGTPGGFKDGAGIFDSAETENGKPVIYRGIWDEITPKSCRWRQGASYDDGATWDYSWIMQWTRKT
jgi:hypothetical protein